MNCVKLLLSSLALVILAACGGTSDSDSRDAEFLKVSAELRQTLPQVDRALSSQSPEGIWRVASHSVIHIDNEIYNEDTQENSGSLGLDFESSSQLLVIVQKDDAAENAYTVYKCDGYRGAKLWTLNERELSYEAIKENESSLSEEVGRLVLTDNHKLVGQENYQYNDGNSEQKTNTIYAGVKVSDSVSFKEVHEFEINLQISQQGRFYQLSDYLINPSCFSISHDEGVLKEYTLATDSSETYNQSSSYFLIEMMNGDNITVYEETIKLDTEILVDRSSYSSNVNEQELQLIECSGNAGLSDEKCLKSLTMMTSVEAKSMSASSQGESLAGETFEVIFSYQK